MFYKAATLASNAKTVIDKNANTAETIVSASRIYLFVVIPFNQPDEKEIPPESDAPAGQGQSRGGRSGRKTRADRIGGISWADHDRCPG